jgi:hypothetical protein
VLLGFTIPNSYPSFERISVIGLLMAHNIINWKYHINCLIMKFSILDTWVDCICKILCIFRNACHVMDLIQICSK